MRKVLSIGELRKLTIEHYETDLSFIVKLLNCELKDVTFNETKNNSDDYLYSSFNDLCEKYKLKECEIKYLIGELKKGGYTVKEIDGKTVISWISYNKSYSDFVKERIAS